MLTHNLGYPRIGSHRELKKAEEAYWAGKIPLSSLVTTGKEIRQSNWKIQEEAGIDLIPCNDFSYYDQVLDMSLLFGVIPDRFHNLMQQKQLCDIDLLFAMARGYQKGEFDITAMEMTKWFDTNYHYIVPEFKAEQKFSLYSKKPLNEFIEAKENVKNPKVVLLGPISFLLLGKEKEEGFHRLELLNKLLPVYLELLQLLDNNNAHYIQIDEPCLSLNLTDKERELYKKTYQTIHAKFPHLHILLTSYFECYGENLSTVLSLPVQTIHLDVVRCPSQVEDILSTDIKNKSTNLSIGVVDGRNIWKNDFQNSTEIIEKIKAVIGSDRILIGPSCSLLHSPCDLDLENNEQSLPKEIKQWLAFAKQKITEIATIKALVENSQDAIILERLAENKKAIESKKTSTLIHRDEVKKRIQNLDSSYSKRNSVFETRRKSQNEILQLPLFPTTTIGSFPQTKEIRNWRLQYKKEEISGEKYIQLVKEETKKTIRWQEEIGLDVLVHGEFERNDMVEYFGEQLAGFAFTQNGWVQSYGSRCVKPPIIYGDVYRPHPMTVFWSAYAQSLSQKWVKGMLTGPVTILQWSFVRNDQPRSETCNQIAFAIRDEVSDLETAGIKIIQIDEPAIREGLPLRKENWENYLQWAVNAFKISSSSVSDTTQIHTHMCYSEFNDIIDSIAAMDADVITIECSRSQMELLDAFADFKYPNEIGPGVYDIHSPRVPSEEEMVHLLEKAQSVIPAKNLWVNPDCGLKTRKWDETRKALIEMVKAAEAMRAQVSVETVL